MNVTSLLTSSLLSGQTDSTSTSTATTSGTKTAAATTPAQRALQASEQRLQTQMQSASTQISSLGQLQSALSGIQTAATALAGLGTTGSTADPSTAVTSFVTAYNAGVTAARTASTGSDDQLLQTSAAHRAGNQLGRAVAGNYASASALKSIGIRQGTDGTLSVDTKAFAAAQAANPSLVRSTLASLGADTGKTVSHALASGGAVATSISTLNARAKALQGQYGAVSALLQPSTSTSTSTSTTSTASSSTAATSSSLWSLIGDTSA